MGVQARLRVGRGPGSSRGEVPPKNEKWGSRVVSCRWTGHQLCECRFVNGVVGSWSVGSWSVSSVAVLSWCCRGAIRGRCRRFVRRQRAERPPRSLRCPVLGGAVRGGAVDRATARWTGPPSARLGLKKACRVVDSESRWSAMLLQCCP